MNTMLKLRPVPTLEDLAIEWIAAKAQEQAATDRRRMVEEQMLPLVSHKDEGTISQDIGGRLKLAVTYKTTRSVDSAAVQEAWNNLPEVVKDAFNWKPELVLKHMRALESANPAAYAVLAKFITTKPAKPSFKIEEV